MSKVLGMSNGNGIDPYNFVAKRDFDPKCVAKSLSNICRYNGHYGWLSVAEHCLLVSKIMGGFWEKNGHTSDNKSDWRLIGLLHDAIESVIGDITTPVKHHEWFTPLRQMEIKYLQDLFEMHNLGPSLERARNVALADKYAMSVEIEHLGEYNSPLWKDHVWAFPAEFVDVSAFGMDNKNAEMLWLETYYTLEARRRDEGNTK